MTPKGYILFITYDDVSGFGHDDPKRKVTIQGDLHYTLKELKAAWFNECDDKWDVDDRNDIHYFYLDLSTGEYHALPKFKNSYHPTQGFDTDHETVMSTKIFKNRKKK